MITSINEFKKYLINEGVLTTKVVEFNTDQILIEGYDNNEKAGFLDCYLIENGVNDFEDLVDGTWFINLVYVEEKFRRKGVFAMLMMAIEKEVKRNQGQMIILRPDDDSEIPHHILIKMYEKLGYQYYHEGQNYYYKYV